MTGIVAGLDASGDQESGNCKYMALVMGTDEKIDSMVAKIERDYPSMRDIKSRKIRLEIASRMDFAGEECIGICMLVDRQNVLAPIMERIDGGSRMTRERIYRRHNRMLMRHMRGGMEGFLLARRLGVHDIRFQCDSDCRDLVRDSGLRYEGPGNAHKMADALAWSNNSGLEPYGAGRMDIAARIRGRIRL